MLSERSSVLYPPNICTSGSAFFIIKMLVFQLAGWLLPPDEFLFLKDGMLFETVIPLLRFTP
jgi:hypothetical protein